MAPSITIKTLNGVADPPPSRNRQAPSEVDQTFDVGGLWYTLTAEKPRDSYTVEVILMYHEDDDKVERPIDPFGPGNNNEWEETITSERTNGVIATLTATLYDGDEYQDSDTCYVKIGSRK